MRWPNVLKCIACWHEPCVARPTLFWCCSLAILIFSNGFFEPSVWSACRIANASRVDENATKNPRA